MADATKIASVVARVPYLNSAPFFHGLSLGDGWEWMDVAPRQLGDEARAGRLTAGLMPVADFLRQSDQYERVANLGIAVRGRVGSVMLFSKLPIRQLDGRVIGVTNETSTSAVLLRLLLEQRYEIRPAAYPRGNPAEADAQLLIGDEALRTKAANRRWPYEIDLAFEWWMWQHLPSVFAVWAVRKDASAEEKQHLVRYLQRQLTLNMGRLGEIAAGRAASIGLPAEELTAYLGNFQYRLSEPDEQAIARFAALAHEHRVLD